MADDCCNPTPSSSPLKGNYEACKPATKNTGCPPLSFRIPISQDTPEEQDAASLKTYETLATAFTWPSEAQVITFAVVDSSKYVAGQCVSILPSVGWMEIVSVPSATSIEVRALASRYNPVPGTGVAAPRQISIGECPKPDVQIADLEAAIETIVETDVAEAIAAQDQSPTFPAETIETLESGRLAVWKLNECSEEAERKIGELHVGTSTSGGPLLLVRSLGCDSEAVRFDRLEPSPSGRGEILITDRTEACSDDAPIPYNLQPEVLTDSCEEGLKFLAYKDDEVSCPGGNRIRKLWRAVTKLIFPPSMFSTADPDADDYQILVSKTVGSCRQLAPIELRDTEVLVGDEISEGVFRTRRATIESLIPPLEQAFLSSPIQIATTGSGTANLVTNGGAFLPAWAHEQYAIVRCRVKVPNDLTGAIEINGQLVCSAFDISNDGPTIGTNIAYVKLSAGTFTYSFLGSTDNSAKTIGGHSFNDTEIVLLGYTSAETLP